jgi:RHS repeat-associated protein
LAGRITGETDSQAAWTQSFGYDDLGRLKNESYPSSLNETTYAYDKNGNRRQKIVSGGSGYTDYYRYDNADKLLWINRGADEEPTSGQSTPYSLYSYLPDGKRQTAERALSTGGDPLSQTYSYGLLGQLIGETSSQSGHSSYSAYPAYDVFGQRTSEWDTLRDGASLNPEKSYWGPDGIYRQDVHGSSAGYNVYTEGLSQRFVPTSGSATDAFYHTDAQGNVRFLTDATGAVASELRYDAFGAMEPQTTGAPTTTDYNPTPFQWGGAWGYQREYRTATEPGLDLFYVGARYYDYNTGQFLSPDPIGFAGGLNRYLYCDDDPINCVDPSGMIGIQFGENGPVIGIGDPTFVFTGQGVEQGVLTGLYALNSVWFGGNPGCYADEPGFGFSRGAA